MRKDTHSPDSGPDSRYYVSDSLYLAAFLYAQGLWLSNVERDADGKYRFVFRTGARCDSLIWQFRHAPKAMVDARTFVYAIEELKDRAGRVRRLRRD